MTNNKAHWNLDHILPVKDFEDFYSDLERRIPKYDSFFQNFKPDMAASYFVTFMEFDEQFSRDFYRLYDLPSLQETLDQTNEQAKYRKAKAQDLELKVEETTRKIWFWLKGKEVAGKKPLDEKNAKRLFAAAKDHEYMLTRMRENAKFTLSEPEERIISQKAATGSSALLDLREMLATEMEYSYEPKGGKKRIIKTQAELLSLVYAKKPAEREAAYKSLLGQYEKNLSKFFLIYQAIVKDWNYDSKMRGYQSPISVRNNANDVSDSAIEVLTDVCRKNRTLFQKFFKIKAKDLKTKKLRRFDLYAPVAAQKDKKFSYQQGVELVLDTFLKFTPNFHKFAKEIIDEGHIDSHPTPVKQTGAFCATIVPDIAPYVLLNYTDKLRDVTVLAHELGHGIHSLYARDKSVSAQHATLPLAETASTFAEMVVFERLLAEETKPDLRRAMLMEKIGDAYATIMRQIYFLIFEMQAHDQIMKGTTPQDLSKMYFELLREQFGSSVEIDEVFRNEWAYIPHMVRSPFYVYSYSFGELLSLSLYSSYKTQGEKFLPTLEKILAAGSSENPEKLLKSVGIDINSAAFWQSSFDLLQDWVSQI